MFNKKAQERFLSWMNILVGLIVASVIIAGVAIFNNFSTDARLSEAKLLNQKISDCIIEEDGTLISNLNENSNIYETCSIKENLFEKEFVLAARIQLSQVNSKEPDITLQFGNPEMTFLCDLTSEARPDNCFTETLLANNPENNELYKISISTASNHEGKDIT